MRRFAIVVALLTAGCAGQNAAQAPVPVNETVTEAIAAAGALANTAEEEYQAGQIAQTAAYRAAINTLGAAYTDARAAYLVLLNAEAAALVAQNTQQQLCAPAEAGQTVTIDGQPTTCATATTGAAAAQAKIATAQTTMTAKLTAMQTASAAVQGIPHK
jgi:hypothetical protein